jgi:hypothetical protein
MATGDRPCPIFRSEVRSLLRAREHRMLPYQRDACRALLRRKTPPSLAQHVLLSLLRCWTERRRGG